jgi:hypothetical protein
MFHPLLLELNTRCWLRSLSEAAGCPITLSNVPDAEFRRWLALGVSHLWLMGAWTTGPGSRGFALTEPSLRLRLNELLPGCGVEELAGSPYAIQKYEVPAALGGESGLKIFKEKLNARGIKLILDFVANHAGIDHAWISKRPDRFVHSSVELPGTFLQATADGPRWFAHGRDPYFPPWRDTVQFDYRNPDTRAAMLGELQSVARRCDGVRCDLAMLQLDEVFAATWAEFPAVGPMPSEEFWAGAIETVKRERPDFPFLAEVYWGLESKLQSLGFDYTYHKQVYDGIVGRRAMELQKHLLESTPAFLARGIHFLENHDEPRAAALLSPAEHRAAALLMLGLPGMKMLYEGQLEGRRRHVPVQFARWPDEGIDHEIRAMYETWFSMLKNSAVGRGECKLLDTGDAAGVVAIQWQNSVTQFDLVVVNLNATSAQSRVRPEIENMAARNWRIQNLPDGDAIRSSGRELQTGGVKLELPAHAAQLIRFSAEA